MRSIAPGFVPCLLLLSCAPVVDGPAPLWSPDPLSADNPFPDERLGPDLRPDWAFHFMPPAAFTLPAEESFERWREFLVENEGWGAYAPVFVRFEERVDANVKFVALESRAVVEADIAWIESPGYLLARPRTPLPNDARIAVVISGIARPEGFTSNADVDAVAALLDVAPDDVALLFTYRTAPARRALIEARARVMGAVPTATFGVVDDGVVEGTFTSIDLRDGGVWSLDGAGQTPALRVVAVLPDTPPPWPAVIAQHGFAGDRDFAIDVARAFTQRGMAVFGIDASSHGERGNFIGFLRVDDPRIAREHLRQTTLDLVQLTSLLQSDLDLDGDGANDLDGNVHFFGHSMGALVGGPFVSVEDRISVSVLNAPGASFYDVFQSERLKNAVALLMRPALGLSIDDPAYDDALPFCAALMQALMEPADPMAYATRRTASSSPLLMQLPVGDRMLPNAATLVLAGALGLEEAAEPIDGDAPLGVLWRLDPRDFDRPPEEDPHGMHAHAPGIHDQAAEFVLTSGRRVIDPR